MNSNIKNQQKVIQKSANSGLNLMEEFAVVGFINSSPTTKILSEASNTTVSDKCTQIVTVCVYVTFIAVCAIVALSKS